MTQASGSKTKSSLRAWHGTLAIALALVATSCKRRSPDDAALETEPHATSLPPLVLTDDTPDLLITWVDGRGDAHPVKKPSDVPTEGRDQVRVVVTTSEAGTRDLFYVANLSHKNPDGAYPVTTMPRTEWDSMISKRREAIAGPSAPAETPAPESSPQEHAQAPAGKPAAAFTVIVYGASWCEACHQAMAYLKQHKVPAVEKDIEQDPTAAAEMQAKLARAGAHGGSIPVIDVKGKILIGFEPHQLQAAVSGASAIAL